MKQRNHVQQNLIKYYAGKSVAHKDKTKYTRKTKHKGTNYERA